jgi:hypothetical protein
MLADDALQSWWERMPTQTRALLADHVDGPIRPDIALHIWQESGFLPVVRPGRGSDDLHRLAWRMAPEVSRFVLARTSRGSAVPDQVA